MERLLVGLPIGSIVDHQGMLDFAPRTSNRFEAMIPLELESEQAILREEERIADILFTTGTVATLALTGAHIAAKAWERHTNNEVAKNIAKWTAKTTGASAIGTGLLSIKQAMNWFSAGNQLLDIAKVKLERGLKHEQR